MRNNSILLACLITVNQMVFAQVYPVFGPEKKVTISGLTFDAMEPFISPDGNTLFFNSLNSGGNTNLYYATRINDTTFTFAGLVNGTYDPSPNHLDAVASLDSLNNFFWVSGRNYPAQMENLHRGIYSGGNVTGITRVYGSFNIYSFSYPYGWMIMDAAINYQSDKLYFCNAFFDFSGATCPGVPCEAKLGIAQKVNDSTFNKIPNSNAIFSNINDTLNYIIYAPQVTKDGLEIYFTRLQKNTINTEICVSVRNSIADTFSLPMVIYSNPGFVPEAASPTTDKQKIYYHQKDSSGLHRIFLRYRIQPSGISDPVSVGVFTVYPNPTRGFFNLRPPATSAPFTVSVYNVLGEEVLKFSNQTNLDISNLPGGVYLLTLNQVNGIYTTRVIKE
jgi:hypothetical protein